MTSLSASANVAGETSGPTDGAVPNAGGAPGVGVSGFCSAGFLVSGACASTREATVAPKILSDASVKNCLRDFDIEIPPQQIIAGSRLHQSGWHA
jgi:hypothetical protein